MIPARYSGGIPFTVAFGKPAAIPRVFTSPGASQLERLPQEGIGLWGSHLLPARSGMRAPGEAATPKVC